MRFAVVVASVPAVVVVVVVVVVVFVDVDLFSSESLFPPNFLAIQLDAECR